MSKEIYPTFVEPVQSTMTMMYEDQHALDS